MHKPEPTPVWDVALFRADMEGEGWLNIDLARRARVSHMTVSRFFRGERQTARTAKKLADALGHRLKRYQVARLKATA